MRQLAVAIHDVEPHTFERCSEIRDWLSARGVDRVTLLVVPAPRLHPFDTSRPELAEWLRERKRFGDAVAQHGLEHQRRRNGGGFGGLRAHALGGRAAEFAGLEAEEIGQALDAGVRVMRRAGLSPRGFVAPAYYYSRALRREVRRRFSWWAGLWRVNGAGVTSPALCLGTSSALKNTTSPALVSAGGRFPVRLLRVDVHPADFDRARHLSTLAAVLDRAAGRAAITYDELVSPSSSRRRTAVRAARPTAAGRSAGPSRAAAAPPPRAEVIVSVTARSAVRATSGASTKRRSPAGVWITIPSKMCSRKLSSTSTSLPTSTSSDP